MDQVYPWYPTAETWAAVRAHGREHMGASTSCSLYIVEVMEASIFPRISATVTATGALQSVSCVFASRPTVVDAGSVTPDGPNVLDEGGATR